MMKKLFLFLTVLVFGITLSSCLSNGGKQYAETSFVYVTSDYNQIYGRTNTMTGITSEQIRNMNEGDFKLFYWEWDEDDLGTRPLGQGQLLNVRIASDIKDINKTTVNPLQNPYDDEDRGTLFKDMKAPLYSSDGTWFADYWVFQYTYEKVEGQEPVVTFYQREFDEDEDLINPSLIEVDVRLTVTGEAKDDASKKVTTDAVVVDMRQFRSYYLRTKGDKIKFKFHYYNNENGDAVTIKHDKGDIWEMIYLDNN